MPLVIISGLPQSGKTKRAHELAAYIREHLPAGKTVEVISEEEHGTDRQKSYVNANEEKKARGNFISVVERRTSADNIVIADGLNYIKGFRYQLYCFARAAATPHCVLYCVQPESVSRHRNEADLPRYPPPILEELLLRFEEPSNQARWDSPLFTVGEDEAVDWAPVLAVVLGGTARPPSMATTKSNISNTDLLVALERTTQQITEKIMTKVRQTGIPTTVAISEELRLILKKPVLAADLQTIRRQFIHMNRLYPVAIDQIESLFVQYLQQNLK